MVCLNHPNDQTSFGRHYSPVMIFSESAAKHLFFIYHVYGHHFEIYQIYRVAFNYDPAKGSGEKGADLNARLIEGNTVSSGI